MAGEVLIVEVVSVTRAVLPARMNRSRRDEACMAVVDGDDDDVVLLTAT
jgi:hypothetical protein